MFDEASQLEMAEREAAIAKAREAVVGVGRSNCEDCGDSIPAARRLAMPSCRRCIDCEDLRERKARKR